LIVITVDDDLNRLPPTALQIRSDFDPRFSAAALSKEKPRRGDAGADDAEAKKIDQRATDSV
jgi:hypothetical protein